jgi:hypothetical protein
LAAPRCTFGLAVFAAGLAAEEDLGLTADLALADLCATARRVGDFALAWVFTLDAFLGLTMSWIPREIGVATGYVEKAGDYTLK